MHEWKITESLIEEIVKHAKENGIKKVSRVIVSLGSNSDITEDSIRFCFSALKSGTISETTLEIKIRGDQGGIIVESIEGEA